MLHALPGTHARARVTRVAPPLSRACVALVLFAACKAGPDFVAPKAQAPASWKSAAAAAPEPARELGETWWTLFDDTELTRLIELALAHNEDLRAALARVDQARAYAGLTHSALLPSAQLGASVERERFSGNRATPPGASSSSYRATTHELPLDISYEVDLWGRLRRADEAARAAAQASAFDRDALHLSVSAEVARTYLALRTTERELDVLRQGTQIRRQALDIVEGRARAGVGNELDTSRAQTELATVEADLRGLERRRAGLENALAVLCGAQASSFTLAPQIEQRTLPVVPAGLPSDILRRRPDIAAAIERLHEANARIGVAEAESYPRLSLTGSLGFVSSELATLFDSASFASTFGAAVVAPIYQGGAGDARNDAARAVFEERAALYRQTLLVAFREVEDALSALAQLGGEIEFQSQAQRAAQRTFELANGRFAQGLVSYLDVVDALRSELDARRARIELEGVRAESTVLLIQALGGGWSAEGAAP